MAGKVLIDGTAYEVKGGRCLVGGTGYSIKKGRTLDDGTGYDISFAPKTEWEKWSVSRQYLYEEVTTPSDNFYFYKGNGSLYYSATKPTINGRPYATESGELWPNMTELISFFKYATPYTLVKAGWYCIYNDRSTPILAKIAYFSEGEVIDYDGANAATFTSRTVYFSYDPTISYSKGTTQYDNVFSEDDNAYPDNGYQGGYWYVKISSANLITFTINGTTYQAVEGATWFEWQSTSYNTAGVKCYDPGLVFCNGVLLRYNGTYVDGSDEIINGAVYTTS